MRIDNVTFYLKSPSGKKTGEIVVRKVTAFEVLNVVTEGDISQGYGWAITETIRVTTENGTVIEVDQFENNSVIGVSNYRIVENNSVNDIVIYDE